MDTDTGYAPDRWAFDNEVSRVFDDMIRRSIPGYDSMRETVTRIGQEIIDTSLNDIVVVDLGCSQGEALASFSNQPGVACIGVDESPWMVEIANSRFADHPRTDVALYDLRRGYPSVAPSTLTLSVLTMMFIPLDQRQNLIQEVYHGLRENGAFIMVEKVLGPTPDIDNLLTRTYYNIKRENGYSNEDIERKRLSLQDVLVPLTAEANVAMLQGAGFQRIAPVWQMLNFAAWVAFR